MSRVSPTQPLLPSILDRLIDQEPDVTTEPQWRQTQTLSEFRSCVLRDVESLLNARPARYHLPEAFHEAAQSVLTYGLPDFTAVEIGSRDQREQLRRAVETIIGRFEPRLRDVRVALHPRESQFDRTLRMTIHALLWVEPDPEPIIFDTLVQPSSGSCRVESK
ncbi:MAG: type VI secretion system baseplate subunit TssE [Pirellulaceae bacterium]